MKTTIKLTAVCMAFIVLYGCIPGISKADQDCKAKKYQCTEGRIVVDYPLSYAHSWDAVNSSLSNLMLSLSYSYQGDSAGVIEAVNRDGRNILITIKSKSPDTTSIAVKDDPLYMCRKAEELHNEIISVID